jgi:hypothetical protein
MDALWCAWPRFLASKAASWETRIGGAVISQSLLMLLAEGWLDVWAGVVAHPLMKRKPTATNSAACRVMISLSSMSAAAPH